MNRKGEVRSEEAYRYISRRRQASWSLRGL